MVSAEFYVVVSLAISLAYAGVAWSSWRALRPGGDAPGEGAARGVFAPAAGAPLRRSPAIMLLLAAAILAHALLLGHEVFGEGGLRFGFAFSISATLLAAGALLWFEGIFIPLGALDVMLTPMAALAVLLPTFFHGVVLAFPGNPQAMRVHLVVAVLAYSLFTLAAILAALMAVVDRHLHRPFAHAPRPLSPLFERMPPLLALESLLFRQIGAGFLLLTATLVSGFVFSEELFGRPLRFDHKTLFAILAWLLFAALLAGRYAFGWRGRVAQRWVFTGFFVLLLAYVGSRFVFEVVLGKGWI